MNLNDFTPTQAMTPNVSVLADSTSKVVEDRRIASTARAFEGIADITADYLKKYIDADMEAKYNKATSDASLDLEKLASERMALSTNSIGEPNYDTLVPEIGKIADTVIANHSKGLTGKALRKYKQDMANAKNKVALKAFDETRRQRSDHLLGELQETLAKVATQASKDSIENTPAYVNKASSVLYNAVNQGVITPKEARKTLKDLSDQMKIDAYFAEANKDPEGMMEVMLASTPKQMGIPTPQYNSLYTFTNKMVKERKEMRRIAKDRADEEEKARLLSNYDNFRVQIDLDPTKISHNDLRKSYVGEKITHHQYSNLQIQHNKALKEKISDARYLENSNIHADTKAQRIEADTALKRLVETYKGVTGQEPNSHQRFGLLSEHIVKGEYAHKEYAQMFGKMLQSTTDAQVCSDLMHYGGKFLYTCQNGTLNYMSNEQKAILHKAHELMTLASKSPVDAITLAREEIRSINPERKLLLQKRLMDADVQEQFQTKNIEEIVKSTIKSGAFGLRLPSQTRLMDTDRLATVLQNYFYTSNGDMATAESMLRDHIRQTWGVNEIEGKSVIMPYPPNKHLNLKHSVNKSFNAYKKIITGSLREEDKELPLSLITDGETQYAIKEKGEVSYQVVIKRGDFYVPLSDKDGNVLRFPPYETVGYEASRVSTDMWGVENVLKNKQQEGENGQYDYRR